MDFEQISHLAFKKSLFWPEIKVPKATKAEKENIPTVCVATEYQEYFRRKNEAKDLKEKEIEDRRKKKEKNDYSLLFVSVSVFHCFRVPFA